MSAKQCRRQRWLLTSTALTNLLKLEITAGVMFSQRDDWTYSAQPPDSPHAVAAYSGITGSIITLSRRQFCGFKP